jgi:peptide/nickel transport system substrate-binding protein
VLCTLFALSLVAAACGDDDDDASDTDTGATATAEAPASTDAPAGTDAPASTDSSTASEPTASGASGAAVAIALGSEPTSLDPHLVDDGGERAINDNIYETLLTRTPEGELEPGLATEMPTQVDDTTWEFKLRDGVTFHDGTPFNADAVVATVTRMRGFIEAQSTDMDGFFSSIVGAEKVDDLTVRIMTEAPDAVLPARMYWLKITAPGTETVADLSDAPNGTGPYKFVSREVGSQIVLDANADYWDGAPAVGEVTYEFVSEGGTRLAGLISGDYDLITNLPPQDVDQAPASQAIQGQEHPMLILDADDGITADPNVRLALNLAIDKDAIAEQVYGGYATPDACQILSPSILGFNDDLSPFPYDPDQAKQLIEDAGVAGQTITLVGESSGRWLNDRELVEAIASYWTDAGLEVDVQSPEFGAYLDVLFDRDNREDAIFVSSSNDLLDPDRQLSTFYKAGGIGASNSDEAMAALIDQGREELDTDAREGIYNDAVKMACDNSYFAFLASNQDLYGLSERLTWTPRVDSKVLVKEMSATD